MTGPLRDLPRSSFISDRVYNFLDQNYLLSYLSYLSYPSTRDSVIRVFIFSGLRYPSYPSSRVSVIRVIRVSVIRIYWDTRGSDTHAESLPNLENPTYAYQTNQPDRGLRTYQMVRLPGGGGVPGQAHTPLITKYYQIRYYN